MFPDFFRIFKQLILSFLFVLIIDITSHGEENNVKYISVIGVGDIMMGTNFPPKKYLPRNDGVFLLDGVREILKDADLTFGNLEGVFLNGEGEIKKCKNINICYAFKMPEFYIQHLLESGFDLLSLANNHVNDFGEEGKQKTMEILEKTGIDFAGLYECPERSFTKNGIKYGFSAYSPNKGTTNINDVKAAEIIVRKLERDSDINIVSFHGGGEGFAYRHVTRKPELYFGEKRGNVYEFAHRMIDAGADIVFGHGPHVTRAVELYKNRIIVYSLGNFLTYARFNLKSHKGIAP